MADETVAYLPEPKEIGSDLYEDSGVTVKEARDLTELFCSRFHLSDECSSSLHSLVQVLLPMGNRFPSGYSYIKSVKQNYDEKIRVLRKNLDSSFCVLNFRFQIRDIVRRHIDQIRQHCEYRKNFPFRDFNNNFLPIVNLSCDETTVMNLVLFSDGVSIIKSTFKKQVWPVWIQLADLPPKLRMARKNFVLAALFVGATHPDWTQLVQSIRAEIV